LTLGDKFEKYEEYFGKRKTTDNYLPIPTAAGRCIFRRMEQGLFGSRRNGSRTSSEPTRASLKRRP